MCALCVVCSEKCVTKCVTLKGHIISILISLISDHLHTITQIIKKSQECGMKISLAFIDYNKAFDSLDHNFIPKALQNQSVLKKLIKEMCKVPL